MQPNTRSTQLRVKLDTGREEVFSTAFRIGRDEECELVIDSGLVSRVHARIEPHGIGWCVRDLGSTNGTYLEGTRVMFIELLDLHRVQFGVNGPFVEFTVESPGDQPAPAVEHSKNHPSSSRKSQTKPVSAPTYTNPASTKPSGQSGAPRPASVEHYIDHYFGDHDTPAGEHTQFIRTAYRAVQTQQKKRFTGIIIAIAVLSLCSLAFGFYQHQRRSRLEETAITFFNANKKLDLQFVTLRRAIEEQGVNLDEQLDLLAKQREDNARAYDGYIRELGLYRELSDKERAIYDVARIFNESGFGMPVSFVGEVMEKIETFWLGSQRDRYVQAIERAERLGYTGYIVEAMRERGLPPEFFYLALQESDLHVDIYGPSTRWGIAKGMWQFIPSTASRFGLKVGPRQNQRVYDELDERHDFYKSTDAAAQYLQEIYGTLAQASGLLVMASYNWGEHRVSDKLPGLPGIRPLREEVFHDIPQDPDHRNYWAFLTQYNNRMPEETKDYVLKIFAAAVIGHNPRLWGLDMDNPLLTHIESLER